MKGLEQLTWLSGSQKALLKRSAQMYKQHARIYFEVLNVKDQQVDIKVNQSPNPAEKYLSAKDLTERANEVFKGAIPEDYSFRVIAVPYKFLDIVDLEYINNKKEELGLADIELSRLLDIRKENLSRLLNDKRGLTKWHKAAFYYLFKNLEK
jgi:hypothetical protein